MSFNDQLNYRFEDQIKLNDIQIPHITLRMGVVEDLELEKLQKEIGAMKRLELSIRALYPKESEGQKLWLAELNEVEFLQKIHKEIMAKHCFIKNELIQEEHFVGGLEVGNRILEYVRNFSHYTNENFHPHITLGRGDSKQKSLGINNFTGKVHVMALGNSGTARFI